MLSPRQKYWFQIALGIVLGLVILAPLAAFYVGVFSGWAITSFTSPVSKSALFENADSRWTTYLFLAVTAFFMLNLFFSHERFPRAKAFFKRARIVFVLLVLSYVASGLSRVSRGPKPWNGGAFPSGRVPIQTSVDATGFPFRFSIDDPDVSSTSSVFDPVLLLANTAVYFLIFSLLWFGSKKLLAALKRKASSANRPA